MRDTVAAHARAALSAAGELNFAGTADAAEPSRTATAVLQKRTHVVAAFKMFYSHEILSKKGKLGLIWFVCFFIFTF